MDLKQVEQLYKKHIYKDKQGIKSDWDKILSEYTELKGKTVEWETVRKYITPEIRERLWEQHIEDGLPPRELEINGDGTQKLLSYKAMSEADSKNPDVVMRMNGYDPYEWELIKLSIGEWTMGNKDNYNYKISLDVRPKDKAKLSIEDILKSNKEYTYTHKKIKHKVKGTDRAIEIGITDTHIGSDYFDEELYKQKILDIKQYIDKEDVEKVYLIFYGDIIHTDNTNNTTTAGTQLTVENNAYDMYRKAKNLMNYTIRELADNELMIYWVQGNHSRLVEFALFDSLEEIWKDNKHITFDTSEVRRKAFLYGNQLVGIYHGDMPKKQMYDWLARDFRKLWGKAIYVEQHSGHLHHEAVETKGAIVSRTLTTIKDTDDYEYGLGYNNVNRVIQTFIYCKCDGLKQINYF